MIQQILFIVGFIGFAIGFLIQPMENSGNPTELQNCVVGTQHILLLESGLIRAVTIADGKSQIVAKCNAETKSITLNKDGVFAFFSPGEIPIVVDLRTDKQLKFRIFELCNHRCDLVLDDHESIYVCSSSNRGSYVGFSFDKDLGAKALSVFSKEEILHSLDNVSEIRPRKIISTELLNGSPVGGRIEDGNITVLFKSLDLSTAKYSITCAQFDRGDITVIAHQQLDFGPFH